jgi:hypothetical protein
MSVTYYKDGKELTAREIKGLNLNVSYRSPIQLGYELVHITPKPEVQVLERAIRDGVELVDGNYVQKWKVVDMFSDYTNEDGVLVTKEGQEAEYLAKKQEQETKAKVQEVTGIIDQYIQAKVDEYNMKNGTLFEKVHNCVAYKDIEGYAHQKFCQDVLVWNAQVWETARQVQVDVLTGVRQEPTEEELLAELPILEL